MKKLIKKLRTKWILYRLRHCKRYKRNIKVRTTADELKQAFSDSKSLDQFLGEILNRYHNEANKDFIQLRLDAGEIVIDGNDDSSLYPDILGKYNI